MQILIGFIIICVFVSLAGVVMNEDLNLFHLPDKQENENVSNVNPSNNQGSSGSSNSGQSETTLDPNFPLNSYIKYGPVKMDVFNDTTEVTFEFDAIISDNIDMKDVYFETKAEGVDSSWKKTTTKYRKVTFPDGPHEYTFWVRAKTNSLVEPSPAYITIKINVSPYYNEVNIAQLKAPDQYANPSLITLSTNIPKGETINITGWTLEGKNGKVTIPTGAEKYDPNNSSSWQQNILLKTNDKVYISSKESPFPFSQLSFRPNKCMGYYLSSKTFIISIPKNCPKPTPDSLSSYLSDKCKSFISKEIGTCEYPNPSEISEYNLYEDEYCINYLNATFNYPGCLSIYSNDSNFTSSQWHIYTDRYEKEIMDRFGDTVYLKDSNGLVVAKYCYEDYCD